MCAPHAPVYAPLKSTKYCWNWSPHDSTIFKHCGISTLRASIVEKVAVQCLPGLHDAMNIRDRVNCWFAILRYIRRGVHGIFHVWATCTSVKTYIVHWTCTLLRPLHWTVNELSLYTVCAHIPIKTLETYPWRAVCFKNPINERTLRSTQLLLSWALQDLY